MVTNFCRVDKHRRRDLCAGAFDRRHRGPCSIAWPGFLINASPVLTAAINNWPISPPHLFAREIRQKNRSLLRIAADLLERGSRREHVCLRDVGRSHYECLYINYAKWNRHYILLEGRQKIRLVGEGRAVGK